MNETYTAVNNSNGLENYMWRDSITHPVCRTQERYVILCSVWLEIAQMLKWAWAYPAPPSLGVKQLEPQPNYCLPFNVQKYSGAYAEGQLYLYLLNLSKTNTNATLNEMAWSKVRKLNLNTVFSTA